MRVLELNFENEDGKVVKQTIDYPIEPVDPVTVSAVMDEIIAANVFATPKGGKYVSKKSARVVERIVETIELV